MDHSQIRFNSFAKIPLPLPDKKESCTIAIAKLKEKCIHTLNFFGITKKTRK